MVGAKRIRYFDGTWPAPGSEFHRGRLFANRVVDRLIGMRNARSRRRLR